MAVTSESSWNKNMIFFVGSSPFPITVELGRYIHMYIHTCRHQHRHLSKKMASNDDPVSGGVRERKQEVQVWLCVLVFSQLDLCSMYSHIWLHSVGKKTMMMMMSSCGDSSPSFVMFPDTQKACMAAVIVTLFPWLLLLRNKYYMNHFAHLDVIFRTDFDERCSAVVWTTAMPYWSWPWW